jgi:hypothetical protein
VQTHRPPTLQPLGVGRVTAVPPDISQLGMNDEQSDKVLELVVFAFEEGTTREQFMGTVDGVTGWIRSQPGFTSYDLNYSAEEHKWVFAA